MDNPKAGNPTLEVFCNRSEEIAFSVFRLDFFLGGEGRVFQGWCRAIGVIGAARLVSRAAGDAE